MQAPVNSNVMFIRALFVYLCLSGPLLASEAFAPCDPRAFQEQFEEQLSVEKLPGQGDLVSFWISVPSSMPEVSLSGLVLKRFDDEEVTLYVAPPFEAQSNNKSLSGFSVVAAQIEKYKLFAHYGLVKTYPDACWYEFEISLG